MPLRNILHSYKRKDFSIQGSAKWHKNSCDRTRTHVWICIQNAKWPIDSSLLKWAILLFIWISKLISVKAILGLPLLIFRKPLWQSGIHGPVRHLDRWFCTIYIVATISWGFVFHSFKVFWNRKTWTGLSIIPISANISTNSSSDIELNCIFFGFKW